MGRETQLLCPALRFFCPGRSRTLRVQPRVWDSRRCRMEALGVSQCLCHCQNSEDKGAVSEGVPLHRADRALTPSLYTFTALLPRVRLSMEQKFLLGQFGDCKRARQGRKARLALGDAVLDMSCCYPVCLDNRLSPGMAQLHKILQKTIRLLNF